MRQKAHANVQDSMTKILVAVTLCLSLSAASLAGLQRPGEPEIRISELEKRIHDLINSERARNKADKLHFDKELSQIARAHSADMVKRKFFGHVNPDGNDASKRGRLAGYTCRKVYVGFFTEGLAENVYQGSLYSRIRIMGNRRSYDWYSAEEIARETVQGWMGSPGHRRNIVEKNYEKEGIGVAISSDHKVYVTEMFC
jgi:uncharacterized protein YkwD